jgi:hypothetical protein
MVKWWWVCERNELRGPTKYSCEFSLSPGKWVPGRSIIHTVLPTVDNDSSMQRCTLPGGVRMPPESACLVHYPKPAVQDHIRKQSSLGLQCKSANQKKHHHHWVVLRLQISEAAATTTDRCGTGYSQEISTAAHNLNPKPCTCEYRIDSVEWDTALCMALHLPSLSVAAAHHACIHHDWINFKDLMCQDRDHCEHDFWSAGSGGRTNS